MKSIHSTKEKFSLMNYQLEKKKNHFLKSIASFLILIFSTNQLAGGQADLFTVQETYPAVKEAADERLPRDQSASSNPESFITSQEFLQDTLTLNPPTDSSTVLSDESHSYEYERYDFKQALDLLRPEYASAVILGKPLSNEEVQELVAHSIQEGIEVALVILYGETVLVSTGSGDEIAASPAARHVLAEGSFVAHTHPDALSKQGPTGPDLEAAGDNIHYVLTINSAYAYTEEGEIEKGTFDWFTEQYLEAIKASEGSRNHKQAREALNLLITEQDRLNQTDEISHESWLAGGTISYSSGLTASSVTTLPGSPYPYLMSGSSTPTSLSLNDSTSQFVLSYDVRQSGSLSGMTISFDNASTSGIETQNLSTSPEITLGLKGAASQVKVEFVDAKGSKDLFVLKNISSSSERFWKIKTSTIVASVDKTKIKEIRIYVDQSTTASTKRIGTVSIRTYGLNTNPPLEPGITSNIPAATNQSSILLSGTKEANTSIWINGIEAVARDSSTTWSQTVSLASDGNHTFAITAKNSIGKTSTVRTLTVLRDTVLPMGTIDIQSGAAFTRSENVTFTLTASDNASGINSVRFSTDDGQTWTDWEVSAETKTLVLPEGDGIKKVYYEVQDNAGNRAVFTDEIVLDTTPPEIVFTSASSAADSGYVLTYTADGIEKSKPYILSEGENKLTFYEEDFLGNGQYYSFTVSLDSGGFPEPKTGVESPLETVFTKTTPEGFVLRYHGHELLSIQDGKGLEFVSPELDLEGNLTGGLLLESDGSKSYFRDDKLVSFTDPTGTKYFYKPDGTLDSVTTADGVKTTFAYEIDSEGNVQNILLTTKDHVSVYDREGFLVRILNQDGTQITFDRGILTNYKSVGGQVTNFTLSQVPEGILTSRDQADTALPRTLLYDSNRTLIQAVLEDQTVIQLAKGLVLSVTSPDGTVQHFDFSQDRFGFLTGGQMQFGTNQRTFGADGSLSQVAAEEGLLFDIRDGKITNFRDSENHFYDIQKMTQEGKILNAIRTQPDGTKTFYVGGIPVKTLFPDGKTLLYKEHSLQLLLEDLSIPLPEFVTSSSGVKTLTWEGHHFIQHGDGTFEVVTAEGWRLVYRNGLLEEGVDPVGLRAVFEIAVAGSYLFEDPQGNRYRLKELNIPNGSGVTAAVIRYVYSQAGELAERLIRLEANAPGKNEVVEQSLDPLNRMISLREVSEFPAKELTREVLARDFSYASDGKLARGVLEAHVKLRETTRKDFILDLEWNTAGVLSRVTSSVSGGTPFRTVTVLENSLWMESSGLPVFEGTPEEIFQKILGSSDLNTSERFVLLDGWFHDRMGIQDPVQRFRLVTSVLTELEEENLLIESRPLEPGEYTVWGITSAVRPSGTESTTHEDYGAPLGSMSGRGGYPNREGVIAPHASFLALSVMPKEAVENLERIQQEYSSVAQGRYGFYDSFNINTGEVADIFTAQDVAVSFIAAANFLIRGSLRHYLEEDPVMERALELVGEDDFSFLTVPQEWESTEPVTDEGRLFLADFARKQWQFFEENVNFSTHFLVPNWVKIRGEDREVAEYSSILDSAFYLVALMGAAELGYLTREEAETRAFLTLQSLNSLHHWEGLLHNYYRLSTPAPEAVSEPEQFISTIDNGWLAAALVMVRQFFKSESVSSPEPDITGQGVAPTVPSLATGIIGRMDFSKLLEPERNQFYVGYHPQKGEWTTSHYGLRNTEIRPTILMAIAKGNVPSSVWEKTRLVLPGIVFDQAQLPLEGPYYTYLRNPNDPASAVAFIPSWGGSLYEALAPSLFIDEARLSPAGWAKSNLIYTRLHREFATGQRAEYEARIRALKESALKRISEKVLAGSLDENKLADLIPSFLIRENFVMPGSHPLLNFSQNSIQKITVAENLSLLFHEAVPVEFVQENGIKIENIGFAQDGQLVSGRAMEPNGRTLIYEEGALQDIIGEFQPGESRAVRMVMPEGLVYRLSPSREGWQVADLIQAKGADGSDYSIQGNEIVSIKRPDGTVVSALHYKEGHAISGKVVDPDGVIRLFENGKLVEILTPQGFRFKVHNEKIGEIVFPDGRQGKWEDIKDPVTEEPLIAYLDGESRKVYKPSGELYSWIFDRALVSEKENRELWVDTGSGLAKIKRADNSGNLLDAIVELSDGLIYRYQDGKLSTVTLKDGTVLSFSENRIVESFRTDGTRHRFIYSVSGGIIENVEVESTFPDGRVRREGLIPFLARDYALPEKDFLTARVLTEAVDLSPLMATFSTDPRTPAYLVSTTDLERGRVQRIDSTTAPNQGAAGLFARIGASDLRSFRFLNVSLRRDSMTKYPSSVALELKGKRNQSIVIEGLTDQWKDFVIPFDPDLSPLYEVTLLVNHSADTVEPTQVYLDHLTFFAIRYDQTPSLKAALGMSWEELAEISRSAKEVPPLNAAFRTNEPLLREGDKLAGDVRTRIHFGKEGQVIQYSRGDGATVQVTDGKAASIDLPGKATVTQTYENGRLFQSLYKPLENPDDPIEVIHYEYDRIRRIEKEATGEVLYTYRYEFDDLDREVTVVKDQGSGEEQYFLEGRLIRTKRPDGVATTLEYDNKGRIIRAKAAFQDIEEEIFDYTYRDDEILIRDNAGLIRHYDLTGRLTAYTTPEGLTYAYLYREGTSSPELERVELVRYRLNEGTTFYYKDGKLVRMTRADGSVVEELVTNEDGNFVSGILQDRLGVIHRAEKGFASELIFPDGEVQKFLPQHLENIWLEKAGDGTVGISGENENGIYKYDEKGILFRFLARDGIITDYDFLKDEAGTVRSAHVSVKKLLPIGGAKIPTLEEIVVGASDEKTVISAGGKEIDSAKPSEFLLLVIDPLTGEITDQARFDLSKSGEASQMNVSLRLIPQGMFVLGGVSGTNLNWGSELERQLLDNTFQQFGLKSFQSFSKKGGGNWVFIGRRGTEPGAAYEKQTENSAYAHVSSHGLIGKAVYAVSDERLAPTTFAFPPGLIGNAAVTVKPSRGLQIFGRVSNRDAALWRKNFNPLYPESGFYRLFPEVSPFPIAGTSTGDEELRGIARQILALVPNHEKAAVYFDDRYSSSWIGKFQAMHLKSRLVELGVTPLDADGLRLWLEREGPGAVVIMAQDVLPDTAVFDAKYFEYRDEILRLEKELSTLTEELSSLKQGLLDKISAARNAMEEIEAQTFQKPAEEQIIRQYLARGGSMVWMHDEPFYWLGSADGYRNEFSSFGVSENGQEFLLGVRRGWSTDFWKAEKIIPSEPGAFQEIMDEVPESLNVLNPFPESIPAEALNWHLSAGDNRATGVSLDTQNQEWKIAYAFNGTGNEESAKIEIDFLHDVLFANSQKLFDLRGQKLVVDVQIAGEFAGRPLAARFFSRDGAFRTQYGLSFDLSRAQPGNFVRLEYTPDFAFQAGSLMTSPGFDPTQIRFLGIELLANGSTPFEGEIAVRGLRVEGVREEVRHLYTDKELEAQDIFQPSFKISIPWDEIALWYGAMLDMAEAKLPGNLVTVSEVDREGRVIREKEAGGRIILYEQGRVKEIVDAEGHVEKRYHYDDAGELTEIEDLVTREEVDQELSKSRKSLFDREMVLLDLLDEQKGILEQKIKKTVAKQRARLRAQRAQLEANRTQKVCRRVIFWKHCDEVPIPGIDGAIGRINSALNKLAKEEARALGTLNEEIGDARGQVSEKTKEAFRDFETKETDLRKSLLRQEMMPVLAEQYRRYVGRDPSQAEVNQWLERAWAVQGLDLNELVQSLMTSAEHAAKIDRKNRILGEIAGWMEVYLQRMGDAHALEEHLAGLGLVQEDIQFNGEFRVQESNWPEILRWLESQDLHFGDSAYRTLLAFAEAQGIPLNDIVLASRVILIDILTGVVNQITEGTLKPSLFALDHAASLYGVEHFIQRLPSLDSLERLISESKMPVMAHINGDHYVLVASVGPELVRYRDLSVGENGEFLEVTRASFLEIWEGTVMAKIQAVDGQEISRTEAKKIKGAFFFLIPVFAAIASAVTAAVSAAVAAVTAVISAIGAAISAALGAIQGALAGLVSSIGNALGAISQGLLHLGQGIWNGLQFVGGKLLAGVKFIGTKLLNGVQFLKSGIAKGFEFVKSGFLKGFEFVKTGAVRIFSGIKDGVVNGFNFLKQGLNKALDFLTVPKGDIVDGVTRYTTTQLIARQVVRGAIGLAAREGLKAMGVPDTIANLAGAFLAGGITGGTGTATASGATNFFRGSLQALAFQGVSELGRHLDLPPPLTDALSIVTRTVTGAALDPSITIPQSLKNLSSKFWADFSLSGLKTLGQIIGLDPKLTSLIGIPLRATLSSLVKSFVNPGVNGGLGDIFTTMKAGLKAGITSIGFDFGGKAGDSFFGSLGSKDIIASIESVIGQSGLFSKVFEVLNQALLNPFNLAGNFIQNLLSKVTSFDFLIQEKGIIGALESMAASIFSRRTIERIRDFGGISGLFGSVSKVFTTLETGEAQELKISDFASLFFDLAGNFIGKKENGILQIGEFGIDSFGKFALITGKVLAEIFGGFVFSGDVKGGQLFGFTISNSQGVVMEGDPEGDGPIVIEGPEPGSQSSGSFWNTVFHLIPYALEFLLKNNFLQNIWTDIDTDLESSEQEEPDNKPLFVLTNGIASGESHAVTPPSYILNLMTDLVNQSQGEILLKDIIPAHIFLRYFNEVGDGVKDIIHWIAESQIPFTALDLVLKIVSILEGYFAAHSQAERLRPVVGMGFSGGFAPLVEALALRGYNAASIVGLGAATMSIAGIGSEVLNTIIEIASKIESGVFEGIEILLKGIPLLGNIVDSLLSFMQNGLIQNAFELLKTTISKLVTPLLLGIPSNADFIVNVWGTKDIVAKLGIGGYRDEIAGLSTENGQIFNIEIIGATHFDYMRYNNPTPQNVIVSDFVTKLITHSTTQEELIQFLNLPPVGVIVTSEVNRFVVRLPGM